LANEITTSITLSVDQLTVSVKKIIEILIKERDELIISNSYRELESNKKQISGALNCFYSCFPGMSKVDRSKILLEMFSNNIRYMFVYGDFFPFDFSNIQVFDSGFYNYNNFPKSSFPKEDVVFFNSEFKGIDPKVTLDTSLKIFDKSCAVNNRLKHAISEETENRDGIALRIQEDFVTLLSILFRNRMFVKKSDNIFKNKKGNIYNKLSIDDYISHFLEHNVLDKENSYGSSSKYHYFVTKEFQIDVRHLLTNNNIRGRMVDVFRQFIVKNFKF
jgi:hypothetical protein